MRLRLSLSFLAVTAALSAQPGVCYVAYGAGGVSATCPLNGVQSPTMPAFIGKVNQAFNAHLAAIAGKPQPWVANSLNLDLMSQSFTYVGCTTSPGSCIFADATKQIAYIDNVLAKSAKAGDPIKYIFWNLDPLPYLMSAEFGALTGNTCAGLGYPSAVCTILSNVLSVDDAIMAHVASLGIKIALAPATSGITYSSLNYSTWAVMGCVASAMNGPQMSACWSPWLEAIIAHANSLTPAVPIALMVAMHEPTEGWSVFIGQTIGTGQTIDIAAWNAAIGVECTAVYNEAHTLGIAIPACGSGYAMNDNNSGNQFVTGTGSMTASPPAHVTMIGVDWYYFGDFSTWPGQGAIYGSWAAAAKTAGLAAWLDEAGPPGHCATNSGVGCNGADYEGCGWIGKQTYNVNNAFASILRQGVSAYGFVNTTLFFTNMFAAFQTGPQSTPNACTDNSTTGYPAYVMGNIPSSPTSAGIGWTAANSTGRSNVSGVATTSGEATVR